MDELKLKIENLKSIAENLAKSSEMKDNDEYCLQKGKIEAFENVLRIIEQYEEVKSVA